jgi:uncharacterized protein YdbL (DUF1318 family)
MMVRETPMIRRLFLMLAVGVALAAAGTAAHASAGDVVAAAKAAGLVGEMGDGFLGLVTGSAPPDVKAAVDEVNAGRAQAYKDIAAKTGVSEQAAAEAAARTLFGRLPPGAYYKPLGGSWTRK